MPEHQQEQQDPAIEVTQNGIKIPMKLIIGIIIAIFSGGGVGVFAFDSATDPKIDVEQFKLIEDQRHEETQSTLDQHGKMIEALSESVSKMNERQLRSEARDEARRVTESIEDRTKREREFERLFEKNIDRLMDGRDPCADVHCGN